MKGKESGVVRHRQEGENNLGANLFSSSDPINSSCLSFHLLPRAVNLSSQTSDVCRIKSSSGEPGKSIRMIRSCWAERTAESSQRGIWGSCLVFVYAADRACWSWTAVCLGRSVWYTSISSVQPRRLMWPAASAAAASVSASGVFTHEKCII